MTNRLLHRLHFKIFRFSQILVIFAYFFNKFPKINWNRNFSVKFSRNFAGISGNCRQLLQFTIFCTIFSKFARIFAVFCIIFRKKKAGWLAVRKMTPPPRRVINSHLKQPRCGRARRSLRRALSLTTLYTKVVMLIQGNGRQAKLSRICNQAFLLQHSARSTNYIELHRITFRSARNAHLR